MTALGVLYWAEDHGGVAADASPAKQAESEDMLIAAGSVPPRQRYRDRVNAARAAVATAPTSPAAKARLEQVLAPPAKKEPGPSPRAVAADGILPGGGGIVATFQAHDARLAVDLSTNPPTPRLFYLDRSFIEPADHELLMARWRLVHDPETQKALSPAPRELERLSAMPPPPAGMSTTPGEIDELMALFQAFRNAPAERKGAALQPLLSRLGEIAAARREGTRKAFSQRAAQIQRMVTRDLIEHYRLLAGGV
jgi:hypothetical protein